MDTPFSNKLTKKIALVLISSSLLISGCRRPPDDEDQDDQQAQAHSSGWHGGGHGVFVPAMGRTGASQSGTSTGSASVSSSARGGFGATGHAAAPGG
jgi:hypothetical protein